MLLTGIIAHLAPLKTHFKDAKNILKSCNVHGPPDSLQTYKNISRFHSRTIWDCHPINGLLSPNELCFVLSILALHHAVYSLMMI